MISTKAISEEKEQVRIPGYDLRKENEVFTNNNISRQVIALDF